MCIVHTAMDLDEETYLNCMMELLLEDEADDDYQQSTYVHFENVLE